MTLEKKKINRAGVLINEAKKEDEDREFKTIGLQVGADATTSGVDATTSGTHATTSGADATTSGAHATTSGAHATTSGAHATTSGADATTSGSDEVDAVNRYVQSSETVNYLIYEIN